VNVLFTHGLARPIPYATGSVNIAGSLAIGWLAGALASGRLVMSTEWRAFVFVGVLGGFTTYSSFMLDTLTLSHAGDRALAAGNVVGQIALGVCAVFLGYAAGTWR
jgi:CrcB protein